MSDVQRYNVYLDEDHTVANTVVLASDYDALRAEIERLKELWFFDRNPMNTEYATEWLRAIRNRDERP